MGSKSGQISGSVSLVYLESQLPVQNNASTSRMSGYLLKRGDVVRNWKRRWFILTTEGFLEYYTSESDSKPLGTVLVSDRVIRLEDDSSKLNAISIETPKRVYFICADTSEERLAWFNALSEFGIAKRSLSFTGAARSTLRSVRDSEDRERKSRSTSRM